MINLAKEVIEKFSYSIGIKKFSLNSDKVVFRFQKSGLLHVEIKSDRIVLYLIRNIDQALSEKYQEALSMVHYSAINFDFAIHAGVVNFSEIFFLINLYQEDISKEKFSDAAKLLVDFSSKLVKK